MLRYPALGRPAADPDLARIREANALHDVLAADGHTLRGPAQGPWKLCCPIHAEHTPSFTVYPDGGYKCFGCGAAGDVFAYVMARDGVEFSTAKRTLAVRAGVPCDHSRTACQHARNAPFEAGERPALILPADVHRPTDADCIAIARSRRINPEAVNLAAEWGFLKVGTVCGLLVWILTDASHRVAEARRVDGKTFPAVGSLGERKAHTLKGSVKSWPCGLAPADGLPAGVRAVLLVEGGPDFLSALHFCVGREAWDLWPVAMLGAGVANIHPDALAILSTRRVRLYPHADQSGDAGAQRWAQQLAAAGCQVDGFDCTNIPRRDGRPCKDLNDLVLAADEAHDELANLLP